MSDITFPTVRMKPKANARAIRHGFPWVFDNELVLDRRTKAIEAGSIARLEDNDRNFLALVGVNPKSKIFGRVLDRDEGAEIDQSWFEAKLRRAQDMREVLYPSNAYRLVHAEADGLPGLVIDRFEDAAVIQANSAWADAHIDQIVAALRAVTSPKIIVLNGQGRARGLEGLAEETRVIAGQVDAPIAIEMNGATYFADILGGQKTGLFFDQRPNHAFAASLARDKTFLDVFSHVGGFSLAALAQGAQSALAVDGSAAALELAQKGAAASGLAAKFDALQSDAFKAMEGLAEEGRKFDVVICDPPAFAPNKRALDAGLRAYERVARLATALVEPGGYLGLCSCSHAADLVQFRSASARGIGRAGRRSQIIHTGFAGPDHPQVPQLAESGYLKSVFFRLD